MQTTALRSPDPQSSSFVLLSNIVFPSILSFNTRLVPVRELAPTWRTKGREPKEVAALFVAPTGHGIVDASAGIGFRTAMRAHTTQASSVDSHLFHKLPSFFTTALDMSKLHIFAHYNGDYQTGIFTFHWTAKQIQIKQAIESGLRQRE